MSTDDNKAVVRQAVDRGFNNGDFAVADEVFSADYTVHAPGLGVLPTGPAAFKNAIGIWRGAFSDIHMDIQQLVAEGEFVCNRFVTTGTHDGPLFGIPPTGAKITVKGFEVHRVVDGTVRESWIGDDVPTILMQLGVVTQGGPPSA